MTAGATCERPATLTAEALERLDWSRFQQDLEAGLTPQAPYLTELERKMYQGGKKMRPRVMMLAARLVATSEELPAKVYKGAAALEMLHVATLVHDDIVDEAPLRRGLPSVVAGRGVKTAVLVGDLQFVQALRGFAAAVNCESDMQLVRRVLDAAFDVCRGELDELDRALPDDPQLRFERYICTIDRKTGALFRLACSAGVELAGGRTRDARRAGFFGRSLGRAFQIIDDIRDIIEFELYAGKEAAVDLMRGRHSLPLLFAVDAMGTHCTIARALRGEEGVCEDALVDSLDALRDCGAIDRAYAEARRQALEALFYLDFFPPGPARDELRALTLEIVDRPVNR